MIAASLPPRDRRALMVGALLLGPVFGWRFALAPYLHAEASAREARAAEAQALARMKGLVAAAPAFATASIAAERAGAAVDARLFENGPTGGAAASFLAYVQETADGASVSTTSLEALPATDSTRFDALVLHLRARASYDALVRFVGALEGGARIVRVDSLLVSLDEGGGAAGAGFPASSRGASDDGALLVRMVLTGHGRRERTP